jgi:hypothetical protein
MPQAHHPGRSHVLGHVDPGPDHAPHARDLQPVQVQLNAETLQVVVLPVHVQYET